MGYRAHRKMWIGVVAIATLAASGCGDHGSQSRNGDGESGPAVLAIGTCDGCGGSRVLRSDDGGRTWTGGATLTPFVLAVAFASRQEAWAVGGSRIVHSTDGGDTWEDESGAIEPPRTGIALDDVAFTDPTHGVAVGAEPLLPSPTPSHFDGPSPAPTPSHFDGPIPTPTPSHFDGPMPTLSPPAAFSGPPLILLTTNGGVSWSRAQLASHLAHASLTSVCLAPDGSGIAIGATTTFSSSTEFVVFRTTDGGATWDDVTVRLPESGSVFAPPACAGDGHVWLLGHPASLRCPQCGLTTLLHSADGGMTWEERAGTIDAIDSLDPQAIAFVDPRHGWISGGQPGPSSFHDALLLRTTDGGLHWQKDNRAVALSVCSLDQLALADADHGIAICDSDELGPDVALVIGDDGFSSPPDLLGVREVQDVAIVR